MALIEIIGLTALAGNVVGWGVGKACDVTVHTAHKNFLQNRHSAKLDPHHDVEKAVLTAHYRAMEFIVEQAIKTDINIEDYSAQVKHVRKQFLTIFKDIQAGEFKPLLKDLSENWQVVVPNSLEKQNSISALATQFPRGQVDAALADFLSMAVWSEPETRALTAMVKHPDFGWAPSFAAYIREAIKTDGEFRAVYHTHVLQNQTQLLNEIVAQLRPTKVFIPAMNDIKTLLKKQHQETLAGIAETQDILRQYAEGNNLAMQQILALNAQIKDLEINRALTEDQLQRFLRIALPHLTIERGQIQESLSDLLDLILYERENYVKTVTAESNIPEILKSLQKEISAFLNGFEYDKARVALKVARATDKDRLEKSARDEATYIIEEAKIEAAALNTRMAVKLYDDAANVIKRYDLNLATNWLFDAGNLCYKRGHLFGDGFLLDAIQIYKKAIHLVSKDKETPLSEHETQWAQAQFDLGSTYRILGEQGEEGALELAISAFEATLTIRKKKDVPTKWAAAQSGLGVVYNILLERGKPGSQEKAINAYEAALTVYSFNRTPREWAGLQNSLGNYYHILGKRGNIDELYKAIPAYKASLKVYSRHATPRDWAMVQNNLGIVYDILGMQKDPKNFNKALIAYNKALTVNTQFAAPTKWAMIQSNIGLVYQHFGELGHPRGYIEAISAYKEALTVRTKQAMPMKWALTIENLADTYWLNDEPKEAETLWRDALVIFKQLKSPHNIDKVESTLRKYGFEP